MRISDWSSDVCSSDLCKRYRHHGMSEDRSYVEQNTRERERLRALVERLDEDELRTAVNEYWTVAGVFGHIAFWDRSEEGRVGQGRVSTCRAGWWQNH